MNLKRTTLTALAIGALALPAAVAAKPGPGHGHGGGGGGHGHGHNPTVMYVFKGTYADPAAGAGVVAVDHGNGAAKKAGLVGEDVSFDLSNARIQVADTDGDGSATANDLQAGDRVQVQARLPKQDPGDQPFAAKKLIDKTNPPSDGSGGD
jgi:hypothetical protein